MRPAYLTPEFLLAAYAKGYFPMGESKTGDEIHWYEPKKRGVIPLDDFHTPASLAKFMRKSSFRFTTDTVFPDVIAACAERADTWINPTITGLYTELWEMGHAHSVECWENDRLVGGLYGVSLGGAFFGESMFSRATNASKASLVHLVKLLKNAGYGLLDAQYVNAHLKQFGIIEVPLKHYRAMLADALEMRPKPCWDFSPD